LLRLSVQAAAAAALQARLVKPLVPVQAAAGGIPRRK
jgi:hypothetical protein